MYYIYSLGLYFLARLRVVVLREQFITESWISHPSAIKLLAILLPQVGGTVMISQRGDTWRS